MDNQLSTIQTKIQTLFKETTPKNMVKYRKGAGGKMFPYVPIDYTLAKLDATFGIFWEFKIIEKQIGKKQVIVQGELVIKSPTGFSVSRPGIGRKNIVMYAGTENPVDIGNDVKAAVSDAIKKGASMFGIAADVYYKELEKYEDIQDPIDHTAEERDHARSRFFAVAKEKGFTPEAAKARIKEVYNVTSMENLSAAQILQAAASLAKYYETVASGESPRKIGQAAPTLPAGTPADVSGEAHVSDVSGVALVADGVDRKNEEAPAKVVPYTCQGKSHEEGHRPKTTVEEPWCSKACQDDYYSSPTIPGNSAFHKFLKEQEEKKQAALAT